MQVIHHDKLQDDRLPETPLREFKDSYHFRLTRKISEGGMGIVYEAMLYGSEGFEKQVVIKTIREEISSNRDFVDLFIGEAKLAACLVHQNIVQIYRLGKVENIYYLAMEYVHGVDLKDFILRHYKKGKGVPIEIAAFIASRICRGLEYAHKKCDKSGQPLGVVHCDISPRNLMISSEGEVKITDFGIARAKGLMKGDQVEGLGKAAYVSPEQIRGDPVDGRSDLFSLGAVLFELLSGIQAFIDRGRKGGARKEIERPIMALKQLNPEVSDDLGKIVSKSLEPDPARRYPDAGAMGYDLEYFLYHKGYGPTIQTLEKYQRSLFPDLYSATGVLKEAPDLPGDLSYSINPFGREN